MLISCCAWALTESEPDEPTRLDRLAGVGLSHVDIQPSMLRTPVARGKRLALGTRVCCVAASHEMPDGAAFDTDDAATIEAACAHVEDALTHAAALGARWSYVVPEAATDAPPLDRYATPLSRIADHGQSLGLKVCIEHFPGTAFPTVAATLDFLDRVGHPNLYLLFDIGHAQMVSESPAEVLPAAGSRLGYVHLDDNDGVGDLHLALTDGVQTRESLADLFGVLRQIGYDGPVSLEMKSDLPDPLDAIRRGLELVGDLVS